MPPRKRRAPEPRRGIALTVQRFGAPEQIEVAPEEVIDFPAGLVGMESLRRFALLRDRRIAPCRWLQSLDDPHVSFVVVDPRVVEPGYAVELPEGEAAADVEIMAIMTIHRDPAASTVNLLAPVVVDRAARTGRQVVQHESGYDVRHPVSPEGAQREEAQRARPPA